MKKKFRTGKSSFSFLSKNPICAIVIDFDGVVWRKWNFKIMLLNSGFHFLANYFSIYGGPLQTS